MTGSSWLGSARRPVVPIHTLGFVTKRMLLPVLFNRLLKATSVSTVWAVSLS